MAPSFWICGCKGSESFGLCKDLGYKKTLTKGNYPYYQCFCDMKKSFLFFFFLRFVFGGGGSVASVLQGIPPLCFQLKLLAVAGDEGTA